MKADLSLAERQRLAAEDQRELRAALVRRNAAVADAEHAIEGVQAALNVHSPDFRAMADELKG